MKKVILWGMALVLLTGCAAHKARQAFLQGEEMTRHGRYEEAVALYTRALQEDPGSLEYRMKLFVARTKAAAVYLEQARRLRREGKLQEAVGEYRQAMALDPSLEKAAQELKQIEDRMRAEELVRQADEFYRTRRFQQAMSNLDQALLLAPDLPAARKLKEQVRVATMTEVGDVELDVASDKPITLKFKKARVKDVFRILSRLSGITFIFDEDVERETVTVSLDQASFAQALELILKMKKLRMRVLNPKTVILYPDTKEKQKQYQDQLIQTFYLSNIQAKKAVNMLRTMLQLRKIYVHEELNALVIRDKPEVVRLAEQILRAADRADSEVLFELELIEVSHTDDLELGASLDSKQVQFGLSDDTGAALLSGATPISSLSNRKFLYTIPSATFDFKKVLSDTEILANPHIRLKNGAKAKVHVGSREPIVTTTNTSTGEITSTNIQYVDVGVKLDLEAHIRLDQTVLTKVQLEVSNKGADVVDSTGNNVAFAISTTNAQTELVLKDGERTILGGLIRDDRSKNSDRLPLVGRIPLIGDLLASHSRSKKKREILLSITPHIVRERELPSADVASIWSGSEDHLQFGPSFRSFARDFDADQNLPRPGGVMTTDDDKPVSAEVLSLDDEPVVSPAGEPAVAPPSERPQARQPVPAAEPPAAATAAEPEVPVVETPVPEQPVEMPAPEQPVEMPARAARVFIDGPRLVDVGKEFELLVRVAEVQNLFSAPVFITYNPQVLQFISASEGDFLRRNARTTVFTASPIGGIGGRLIIGYKQGAGGQGTSGDGVLYHLRFKPLAPGSSMVNLERINFRDPTGSRLRVAGEGLTVEVR
ncbi:secretin N-terminal domain-containing protein [Geothermobacter ehrlichii]|nr:secretin N-terminal domain-containing protein [Geothermobacter ehrlichii]